MYYADELGLDAVLSKIESFRKKLGDRYWKPAPLLTKLCEENKTLAAFRR